MAFVASAAVETMAAGVEGVAPVLATGVVTEAVVAAAVVLATCVEAEPVGACIPRAHAPQTRSSTQQQHAA